VLEERAPPTVTCATDAQPLNLHPIMGTNGNHRTSTAIHEYTLINTHIIMPSMA
jgi:hypothetical protein